MAISYEYLPVQSSELPVEKIFTIDDNDYGFEFRLNSYNDRIIMYIKDLDDNILYTTKIVYGNSLYNAEVSGIDLDTKLVAFDINDLLTGFSIESETVDSDNFGDTVKIYLVE